LTYSEASKLPQRQGPRSKVMVIEPSNSKIGTH